MILLEILQILTTLQKLPQNVGDLGKLIAGKGFKSCPMWSHWLCNSRVILYFLLSRFKHEYAQKNIKTMF